jgi:hypothetical protein
VAGLKNERKYSVLPVIFGRKLLFDSGLDRKQKNFFYYILSRRDRKYTACSGEIPSGHVERKKDRVLPWLSQ